MENNDSDLIQVKWTEEFKATAERYHRIVVWVAVVFNILFFITDYINVEEHWKTFFCGEADCFFYNISCHHFTE